jgi:hypothetical protein
VLTDGSPVNGNTDSADPESPWASRIQWLQFEFFNLIYIVPNRLRVASSHRLAHSSLRFNCGQCTLANIDDDLGLPAHPLGPSHRLRTLSRLIDRSLAGHWISLSVIQLH